VVRGELQDVLQVEKEARQARVAAGKPTARVEARAAATRHGAARRGPARGGERRRGCWGSTWRRGKRRGAAGARHMAGEGGGSRARAETERGGLEVDEEGPSFNFPKVQGLHCKV
jgi:hypothetical protein